MSGPDPAVRTVTPGAWLEALGTLEDRVEDRMRVLEGRVRMLTTALAELVADRYGEMPRQDEDGGSDELPDEDLHRAHARAGAGLRE